MKKIIALMLVAFALLGLAACQKETPEDKVKRKAGELMDAVKDAVKD